MWSLMVGVMLGVLVGIWVLVGVRLLWLWRLELEERREWDEAQQSYLDSLEDKS